MLIDEEVARILEILSQNSECAFFQAILTGTFPTSRQSQPLLSRMRLRALVRLIARQSAREYVRQWEDKSDPASE